MPPKKTCPVCSWEINDEGKTAKIDGRLVIVCCDDCLAKVKKDPDKYIKAK